MMVVEGKKWYKLETQNKHSKLRLSFFIQPGKKCLKHCPVHPLIMFTLISRQQKKSQKGWKQQKLWVQNVVHDEVKWCNDFASRTLWLSEEEISSSTLQPRKKRKIWFFSVFERRSLVFTGLEGSNFLS